MDFVARHSARMPQQRSSHRRKHARPWIEHRKKISKRNTLFELFGVKMLFFFRCPKKYNDRKVYAYIYIVIMYTCIYVQYVCLDEKILDRMLH